MSSATWLVDDLGDGGGLADDRGVEIAHLGGADERPLVVGDDDEAMLPELLEGLLLEAVAEDLAGQRRQLGVREDDDVDLPLRGALQLGRELLDLARPAAEHERAAGRRG